MNDNFYKDTFTDHVTIDPTSTMSVHDNLDWVSNTYDQNTPLDQMARTGTNPESGTAANHRQQLYTTGVGTDLGVDFLSTFDDYATTTDAMNFSLERKFDDHAMMNINADENGIFWFPNNDPNI